MSGELSGNYNIECMRFDFKVQITLKPCRFSVNIHHAAGCSGHIKCPYTKVFSIVRFPQPACEYSWHNDKGGFEQCRFPDDTHIKPSVAAAGMRGNAGMKSELVAVGKGYHHCLPFIFLSIGYELVGFALIMPVIFKNDGRIAEQPPHFRFIELLGYHCVISYTGYACKQAVVDLNGINKLRFAPCYHPQGLDKIQGYFEVPGQAIPRTEGQDTHRDTRSVKGSGNLVDRPVTAAGHYNIITVGYSLFCQFGRIVRVFCENYGFLAAAANNNPTCNLSRVSIF